MDVQRTASSSRASGGQATNFLLGRNHSFLKGKDASLASRVLKI